MTIETFLDTCKRYGDQSLPENERWKSIKYFSTEGQMESTDFEFYYKHNEAYFINDSSTGPGFIFLETPYTEFGAPHRNKDGSNKKIITFVSLIMVNALGFTSDSE